MNDTFYCHRIFPSQFNNIKVLRYHIRTEKNKGGGNNNNNKNNKNSDKPPKPQTLLIWESKGKEELKVRSVGFTLKNYMEVNYHVVSVGGIIQATCAKPFFENFFFFSPSKSYYFSIESCADCYH